MTRRDFPDDYICHQCKKPKKDSESRASYPSREDTENDTNRICWECTQINDLIRERDRLNHKICKDILKLKKLDKEIAQTNIKEKL